MTPISTALRIGQVVWTIPTDQAVSVGGMVVAQGVNHETGEQHVEVISTGQLAAQKRKPHIIVHHQDGRRGAYADLGCIAHIERWPLERVDAAYFADQFRDARTIYGYERAALFTAGFYRREGTRNDSRHDSMITAYRALRTAADELTMKGVA